MRSADVLAPDVRALIQRHIPTPLHLEALVTLARERDRAWSVAEVAGAKYQDHGAVERALRDYADAGLVRIEGTEQEPRFQLATLEPRQAKSLEMLVDGYNRMPVQVVRAVYERPPEAVQSFADAFRLNKPK